MRSRQRQNSFSGFHYCSGARALARFNVQMKMNAEAASMLRSVTAKFLFVSFASFVVKFRV
jgi:hypothetical protein